MGGVGPELPSGTVTFLFSDIEASTAMVHALGAAWADVLDLQRRLCRRAWARHDGHELGTEGDSFFVAFASPTDAVAAALRAQRSLAAATWPAGAEVRVRMGVHTGTPSRHDEGYVGMDVHRAARVAAAAHGGQLLVSEATMRLVADALSAEVVVLDLGEHRLKDIPSRTRLFQLDLAGHQQRFAPPRTLGGAGSLPTTARGGLAEVVGRDGEIAEVAAAICPGARLVTLTGPGGVGKSTLATAVATAVADRFPDGVFVAPMVAATDAAGMWAGMSRVLDVPPDGQVPPGFFTHVRDRRLLLVLDNLEQIADADAVVRDLLDQAPHVTVLATSRRPLHLVGEHEHVVPGLEPEDAVALFARHAARARRGFVLDAATRPAVEALCAALDRLPLALEIAAARVKVMSPQAVLTRIDSSLDLALHQRDRDDRQATLRGAIAWSHDLLDAPRRTVLEHLGVFLGGAPLPAVEAVVPPGVLAQGDLLDVLFDLVDHSMVVVTDTVDGEPRFHLLETVRRFALDRLRDSGDLAGAESRHAQYYLDLLVDLHPLHRPLDFREARATVLLELANVDASIGRADAAVVWDGVPLPSPHRCALLADVALEYRLVEESRRWCGAARGVTGDGPWERLGRAWLLAVDARREAIHGGIGESLALARRAATLLESWPDGTEDPPWRSCARVLAELATCVAWSARDPGDVALGDAWYEQLAGAAPRASDPMVAVLTVQSRGYLAYHRGDLEGAREASLELAGLWDARGFPPDLLRENDLADFDTRRGREDLAHSRLAGIVDDLATAGDPITQVMVAQTLAESIGAAHPATSARIFGCISVFRVAEGLGLDHIEDAADPLTARVKAALSAPEWASAWERGRVESLIDLAREAAALPTVRPTALGDEGP